jgi:hypothetical protein
MTTLLIITGPQGSGNHLFSKIFALSKEVQGWSALNDQYWIGHDQEPFAECWHRPELLDAVDWQHNYYVTSISCPYVYRGETMIPDYNKFISRCPVQVKLAIIGRDQTILEYQQSRVRGRATRHEFLKIVNDLMLYDPIFISQELLYLYGTNYIKSIGQQLNFPVSQDITVINEILKEDANKKYIKPVLTHWLDDEVKQASRKPE